MFYCSVSTAAVSYCHTHIHQTYYVGLRATYIYNTGKRQAQEKPPMVINMLLQGTRVLRVVAWPIRGMGGVQQQRPSLSDSVLAEWLNRDRGNKSSEQVATLAQKVNVQFCKSVWPQAGRRQPPREQANACNIKTEGLLQESSLPPVRAAGYLPSLFLRIA